VATVELRDEGAVRVLTLTRPEVHNCVDGETAVRLAEAIEAFGRDAGARVLVVTGAGRRAFCSGADLRDVAGLAAHPWVERAGPMGFARLDPGKPTIAAVNGYCFAGGTSR
jgi:enoyl-CoA hydratase